MRLIARVVGHWTFALGAIVGVGLWFLVIPALTNQLGANPLEELLHRCGEIAIWLLGTVLALSPLRTIFPQSPIVAALNRHRRWIGVSAFIYGSLHLTCHILYEGGWVGFRASWSKPFILVGLAGWTVLLVLAMTSSNWATRKMGGKNWKLLHRLAYVAAALLLYHQAIAGKGHWYVTKWLLFPLLALQLARLGVNFWRRRNRTAGVETRNPNLEMRSKSEGV